MSVGLGIFLGLVFCGFVYLYTKNPDRWNLKKISKLLGMAIGAILLLSLIFSAVTYFNSREERQPTIITQLNGVEIGMSYADFMFTIKGSNPFDRKWDRPAKESAMPNDGTYKLSDGNTEVVISDDKVTQVSYTCNEPHDSTKVGGIGCDDTGKSISDRYGDAALIICPMINGAFDPKVRVYRVDDYGVLYFLYENQVKAIYVYDKKKPFKKSDGDKRCG